MTADPTFDQRVSRLENDTDSIYELLGDFRAEFNEFRDETRDRFARIDQRFDEVLRRLPETS